MTIDAIDVDFGNLQEWLKSDEAGELQRDLEERIMKFLFSHHPADFQFLQIIEQLARIGANPNNRSLLEREISELKISLDEDVVLCRNFFKNAWDTTCKIGRFLAEHKTEILVGVAICATGIGIAYVTGYTLSAAVGGVIVAGAGSIFTPEEKPNPHIPQVAPPSSKEEIAISQQPLPFSTPKLELPSWITEFLVTADGIWVNGQFFPTNNLMNHSLFAEELAKYGYTNENMLVDSMDLEAFPSDPKPQVPEYKVIEPSPHIEQSVSETPVKAPQTPNQIHSELAPEVISKTFTIPGMQTRGYIGWINGINNSFEESKTSGTYLQSLAGGHTVSGIYNRSHTPVIDVLEAALLNHRGHSPITAKLLQKEWIAFHEANIDNPNAKLLQVCHSQGAIHVKNALEGLPPEIRDRVIVVAIAPAAVVPDEICFKSFNYASEKDFVYKLDPSPRPVISLTKIDGVIVPSFEDTVDHRDELIILSPHPNAKGFDHEFQSPTYQSVLRRMLENYEQHQGEYTPEEKGNLK